MGDGLAAGPDPRLDLRWLPGPVTALVEDDFSPHAQVASGERVAHTDGVECGDSATVVIPYPPFGPGGVDPIHSQINDGYAMASPRMNVDRADRHGGEGFS